MLPTPIGRPGPTISERRSAVLAQSAMRAISHRLGDRVCDLHPVLLGDHDPASAYVLRSRLEAAAVMRYRPGGAARPILGRSSHPAVGGFL